MAIAGAAAYLAHVAGHGHQRVQSAHRGAAVDVALQTVTNPDGGRLVRAEFLGHLGDTLGRYAGFFSRPE